MISVCAVTYKEMKPIEKVLIDSIANSLPLVKEIILAVNDAEDESIECEEVKAKAGHNISVKRVGFPLIKIYGNAMAAKHVNPLDYGHALGLHAALDHAMQEFIMLTDPDVFFLSEIDKLYLSLWEKYNLNIIGVSHHWSHALCFTYFPCTINCLFSRKTLPDHNWLKGLLYAKQDCIHMQSPDSGRYQLDGKFLIPSPIPELADKFPNKIEKDPIFDVGCNLWLWNEERHGRWLSFQTLDVHNYNTLYNTNFKCKDKIGNQKLLYHLTRGYHAAKENNDNLRSYLKMYQDYKELS